MVIPGGTVSWRAVPGVPGVSLPGVPLEQLGLKGCHQLHRNLLSQPGPLCVRVLYLGVQYSLGVSWRLQVWAQHLRLDLLGRLS